MGRKIKMHELLALVLVSLVAVSAGAMTCAGINPLVAIRKTLMPMTSREFWFPPCFLCWGVRGLTATAALVWVIGV